MNGIADLQRASSAAQKDPRMAAASELVSSAGLEALGLPPATEAALNIQEATNLIGSADQLLAQAGKPTSATVLQQRQQQALDGIAGALARVQQSTPPRPMRGQPRPPMMPQQRPPMMGQQRPPMMGQQRPPMMGQQSPVRPPMQGVAGMPAPNMARAAQGGIVGFAQGTEVEEKKSLLDRARGLFSGQYSADTEGMTPEQHLQYLKNLREERIAQGASAEEIQRIEEAIRSYEGTTTSQGMAGGGIVAFAGPDGSEVELDEDLIVQLQAANVAPPREPIPTIEERRIAREASEAASAARIADRDAEFALRARLANQYPNLGVEGIDKYIEAQRTKRLGAVGDLSGIASLATSEPFRMVDEVDEVDETVITEATDANTPIKSGGDGNPTTDGKEPDVIEDIVTRINEIDVEAATSPLTKIVSDSAKRTLGRDRTAEEEQRRQDALDFYGLSDRERDLRQQAADTQTQALAAELDPEVLRQQKINSILGNLSGPGGIIGAGNRGAASRTAFDKRIRDIEAEKALLPIASELETLGMDRAAREKAFGAGTELAKNFSAEMNTALQSLANLSSVQMSSATSAAIQNARANITALTTQASGELAKLREKGLNIRDNREYQRRLREGLAEMEAKIGIAMAELEGDTLMNAEQKANAQGILTNSLTAARRQIMGEISRGGSEDPELDAIIEQYN
tara:strand:- start:2926 stop:4989 length:2064 start_codon:yes stop_codon:yes gene_type:complete